MKVKIKKISSDAVIPTYAKNGDAGMDIIATSIINEETFQITYGTGISMEIPNGFVGLIFPRSSVRKTDLSLSNCVGVVDSGYRGEIQATFRKHKGVASNKYEVGDRIAQIMIIPHPPIEFEEVEELSDTERGDGGFGSTGK
jgi:dUTP pyrophosphatase